MEFSIIAAVDSNWGLSKQGILPWSNTFAGIEDMKFFRSVTKKAGTAVIMGRKTWDSLPHKPLPKRINIVISRSSNTAQFPVAAKSLDEALKYCAELDAQRRGRGQKPLRVFVIGGREIYTRALFSPYLTTVLITQIHGDHECDVRFPATLIHGVPITELTPSIKSAFSSNRYLCFDFTPQYETSYIELLKRLLNAPIKNNRTKIPAHSICGAWLEAELTDSRGYRVLPMLTIRKLYWPAIYHELIWFLRGSTTTKYLQQNGVKIWDGNSSREYLNQRGLKQRKEGVVGPIYGFQWRHWNGRWNSAPSGGIDQLAKVIKTLKTDPWSRRMVVSSWNPEQLDEMALEPCHYSFQFVVDPDSDGNPARLNCVVNMRSADLVLGVPFNMVSYSLLTHMISHITGIAPGKLVLTMADCHLYTNHVSAAREMVQRKPRRSPVLTFSPAIHASANITIDDFAKKFKIEDYIISDYAPHPPIKLQMAV